MRLIAKKRFRFDKIELEPGDAFVARYHQAKVLKALGRARDAGEVDLAPISEPLTTDKALLREEYMRIVGKRPFNGWGEDELRGRIRAYERRDMRAAP